MADEQRTTIDSLLELLSEKGRLELNAIALDLKTPPTIVEEWSKILEKGGLVKITYELGRMYVSSSEVAPGEAKSAEARLKIQQEALDSELETNLIKLQDVSTKLDTLKASGSDVNKLYSEKMPEIRSRLNELNNIYAQVQKQQSSVFSMRDGLERDYESLNKKATEMLAKLSTIESGSLAGSMDDAVKRVEQVFEESKKLETLSETMRSNKDKRFDEVRSELDAQVKRIRADMEKQRGDAAAQLGDYTREIRSASELLKERIKEAKAVLAEVDGFRREQEKEKKALNDSLKRFNDAYAKGHQEMADGARMLGQSSSIVLEGITNLKNAFGDSSKFYDVIYEIQSSSAEIEKRIQADREQIRKLKQDLSAINVGEQTLRERVKRISDVSKKAGAIEGDIVDMESGIDTGTRKIGKVATGVKKGQEKPRKRKPWERDSGKKVD